MYNKIILVGNLTRDPELKYMPNGGAVTSTGIATSRKFKKQDGTKGEETCFVDLTFFGKTAEVANQYLHRGSKLLVEGRLSLSQWQDQNGGKRSKHSVVVDSMQMMDSKSEKPNSSSQPNNTQQYQSYQQPDVEVKPASKNGAMPDIDVDDDEIPF